MVGIQLTVGKRSKRMPDTTVETTTVYTHNRKIATFFIAVQPQISNRGRLLLK